MIESPLARTDRRVAVITRAGSELGRRQAVALAARGADIIAIDRYTESDSVAFALSTQEGLDETAKFVRAAGGRVHSVIVDVRELSDIQSAITEGIDVLGDVDVLIANAWIVRLDVPDPVDEQVYVDILDTNLRGTWNTIVATAPSMIRKGDGGSMILISALNDFIGRDERSIAEFAFSASSQGLIGLMRAAAEAYAPHKIRVNCVHTSVSGGPTLMDDDIAAEIGASPNRFATTDSLLSRRVIETADVTRTVMWLTSDEARYTTGLALPINAPQS